MLEKNSENRDCFTFGVQSDAQSLRFIQKTNLANSNACVYGKDYRL